MTETGDRERVESVLAWCNFHERYTAQEDALLAEFAAIRAETANAAAEKVEATQVESNHTALINGILAAVESHPTRYQTLENGVRTTHQVSDEWCVRCVVAKWAEALAAEIRSMGK